MEVFDEEGLLITGEAFCEKKFLSNNTKLLIEVEKISFRYL
jgi:hypothetical protein